MSDSKHTIYERMFHSAVAALAEISDALGIPEDVASTANGNAEILHAIRALLKERDALAAKVASYERADRDLNEALNMGDGSYSRQSMPPDAMNPRDLADGAMYLTPYKRERDTDPVAHGWRREGDRLIQLIVWPRGPGKYNMIEQGWERV